MAKAIILYNMGAARSASELKQFLLNMFLDKRIISGPVRYILAPLISQTRYKKVWKKYEEIGGSRLYEITENICKKLQNETGITTVYAMRYTQPYLSEVIHDFDEVMLLPMYPQYSTTTVESSLDALKKTKYRGNINVIKPFYNNMIFNNLIASNVINTVSNPQDYHLIFSAHGLPQKIIDKGDPYQKQLQEQVEILKKLLPGFKSAELAYQSRFGRSRWLQPYLEDTLKKYPDEKVLIYPLSFMVDNSETDLELKIEYNAIAQEIGIKEYKVVECPNDKDETIQFLADLVRNNW